MIVVFLDNFMNEKHEFGRRSVSRVHSFLPFRKKIKYSPGFFEAGELIVKKRGGEGGRSEGKSERTTFY